MSPQKGEHGSRIEKLGHRAKCSGHAGLYRNNGKNLYQASGIREDEERNEVSHGVENHPCSAQIIKARISSADQADGNTDRKRIEVWLGRKVEEPRMEKRKREEAAQCGVMGRSAAGTGRTPVPDKR